MSDYQDKLSVAEDSLAMFIAGKINADKLGEKLSAVFSAIEFFGARKNYHITVGNNGTNKQVFFGACVYPKIEKATELTEAVVVHEKPFAEISKAWAIITDWEIEIDKQLFDRNELNMNPKEIVAILLHEIGHTVYSDKVVSRFYRMYRKAKVGMKSANKETLKLAYGIFSIALALSCTFHDWKAGKYGIKEEMYADSIVRKCGYGDFFISGMAKIIAAYGDYVATAPDTMSDGTVSERIRWGCLNIIDFTRRKERLCTDMYMEAARTPSEYLKALYAKVLNTLGVNLRENYTGDAVECDLSILNDPTCLEKYSINTDTMEFARFDSAIEATLHLDRFTPGTKAFEAIAFGKKKKGLPSWIEIDRIQIEIDKMKTQADREFVLDLIYDKINEITEFMEYITQTDVDREKYAAEAQKMLDALNKQREQVLAKKNFNKSYRVFVPSPAGYEG